MRSHRLSSALIIVGLLLSGTLAQAPSARAAAACFAETGFCVRGRFLAYWQAHGQLARNGFPLSEERREVLEDGNEYIVQYFERVRLEYHPEHAVPYDVLLGQFGRRVLTQRLLTARIVPQPTADRHLPADAMQPADPLPDRAYFPETGHNLGGRFLAYWQANGRLPQFGFPLTEEVEETLEDGRTYLVQYFERARLEYHPEHAAPYDVLLGQFGRGILAQVDLLTGDLGHLYATNAGVRERLGAPTAPAVRQPGATHEFERGRMFYRRGEGGVGLIYVLCGDPQAGPVIGNPPSYFFFDTFSEDQAQGGGPAPVPGLFLPQRGFGTVWREHQGVRDCLGYARTAEETGYTITAQHFQGGLLLAGPEDRSLYAFFVARSCFKCGESATYERFAAPAR